MKKYIIYWNREEYGKIIIEAENEELARDKFERGSYEDENLIIKSIDMNISDVEELK